MVSNLRFSLNSARSPVNKLSPELLSQIFAYLHTPGIPSQWDPPQHMGEISSESLATVNLVCRYWRQTANRTKEIHVTAITVPGPECQSEKHGKDSRTEREKWVHPVDPNPKLKERSEVTTYDFEVMRCLSNVRAGKVLLVRHKPTSGSFALKVIAKNVLTEPELQQTLTEQAVLKWMTTEGKNPFIVKLWWSFRDRDRLFLVMDFHPCGDLATQLARWGRLGRHRARFYAAEIVEGVEGLHKNGIIYRNLKPDNILIGSDGHIALTGFGLSKRFPRRPDATAVPQNGTPGTGRETTNTICGTAKYLAPEVIQGLPYSFEVDWWSFGTMLYEMLTGIVWTPFAHLDALFDNRSAQAPFWADNQSDMYSRVIQDVLQFPEDRSMDLDTKRFIRVVNIMRRFTSLPDH